MPRACVQYAMAGTGSCSTRATGDSRRVRSGGVGQHWADMAQRYPQSLQWFKNKENSGVETNGISIGSHEVDNSNHAINLTVIHNTYNFFNQGWNPQFYNQVSNGTAIQVPIGALLNGQHREPSGHQSQSDNSQSTQELNSGSQPLHQLIDTSETRAPRDSIAHIFSKTFVPQDNTNDPGVWAKRWAPLLAFCQENGTLPGHHCRTSRYNVNY
ncbi:unnamed protein product [Oppiella nova]|uniref:Uncharacterized protein n=1 Tax=Oppiella nova TaxID=334625 RepID=A0A7R9QU19_9ACAR|nr:unnamed protein product [Oppiella nova]CAG2174009.1 unnamed protein product [Oppiella nova]